MKRSGLWAACVMLLAGVGFLTVGPATEKAGAEKAMGQCSVATLRGTYLFAYDGIQIKGHDQLPYAAAGTEVYHGNGSVNGVFSVSQNGKITRNLRLSGTYTVKADCTGTVTYPEIGARYDEFVAPDGSMFTFLETNQGFVGAGSEFRGSAKRVGD
jgi:hypothetical protein